MRVVFMGTPEFAVPALEKLIEDEYEVVAVYTQPDKPEGRGRVPAAPPVKRVALRDGLQVLQPSSLRQPEEAERLSDLRPDVVVVAAFGQILPPGILEVPEHGCLNIHPSLLPSYRGATPIPAAILAGDEDTGVTIMLLDAGMDTGPTLSQFVVEIEPEDTTDSLTVKLAQAGARLLGETLPAWVEGSLVPRPQDESRASYTHPIVKENGAIDWRLPAEDIWRGVRAYCPWPGSYTWWRGRMMKILQAIPLPGTGDAVPGRVTALPSGQPAAVGVETGAGILGLVKVQIEGKRAMSAEDFVRGQQGFLGDVLGKRGPEPADSP